jgi:hypothetical protein
MSYATLAILLSEEKTHELVPRGIANNKQTSASAIALCTAVDRVRTGLPAAFSRAQRWVHTVAEYSHPGVAECRKNNECISFS